MSAAEWKRIASSIRIRHGQFFKLDVTVMGAIKGESYLVVSTVKTSHCEWSPIDAKDAAERLCNAIRDLSASLKVRVWYSSRHWQLLPNDLERNTQYEFVGRLDTSWRDAVDVLEGGIHTKPIEGKRLLWLAWCRGQLPRRPLGRSSPRPGRGTAISKFNLEIGLPGEVDWADDGAALNNHFTT